MAKDLEGKIPLDTISIEIVNQMRGRASERFIHECLDEKYKQQHRVENAKKQRRRQERDENLAALAPLNQQEQQAKNKEIIVNDVNGRSIEEEKEENSKLSPTIGNAFTDISSIDTEAAPQSPGLKDQSNLDLKDCPSCKELYFENCELKEALEKTSQLITADKVSVADSLSALPPAESVPYSLIHKDTGCDILEFEFHLLKGELLEHMGELYPWIDDGDCKVWFSGKIDKKSGHVISAKTGVINQQQNDRDNREAVQNE